MPRQPNHYRILDVALSADHAEIQHAYRELAKRYHPDRVPVERREWARAQMARINAAYAVLGDPARRATYDRQQGYVHPGSATTARGAAAHETAAHETAAHETAAHETAAHEGALQPGHKPRRGPTRREGQRRVRMSRQRVHLLGSVAALGVLLLGALYWWRMLASDAPQQRWVWAALLAAGLVLVGIIAGQGRP
jgi:DnaJ-class molecular chaperone